MTPSAPESGSTGDRMLKIAGIVVLAAFVVCGLAGTCLLAASFILVPGSQ
jgi:hypothetical protein